MTLSNEALRSIATPDRFESRVGALEFVDGVPSGETAERVHGFYRDRCPVYRSLRAPIAITTELVFEPVDGSPS